MTQMQSQATEPCAVDLTVSELPESAKAESDSELFTTVIEPTVDANSVESSTSNTNQDAAEESGFAGFGFSEALLKTLEAKGGDWIVFNQREITKAAVNLSRNIINSFQFKGSSEAGWITRSILNK